MFYVYGVCELVFRYSDRCPQTLAADVGTCNSKHLTNRHVLRFHQRNQLVAVDGRQSIVAACKAMRLFKRCLSRLQSSCRRGVKMLLNYQPDLHKYLLKMNVICRRRVLPVYKSSSECYRKMIAEGRLDDCNSQWTQLAEVLTNVSAYEFYCQLNETKRRQLIARINILAVCHKHHYERYCGTLAASVMNVLVRRALNDPVFLRYRYRPHCASHATPPTTTLTLTLTSEPSTVDLTTKDELATTFVNNSTSVTTEAVGSGHWQTGELFDKSDCVTLNVSVVTSLLAVLTCIFAIK